MISERKIGKVKIAQSTTHERKEEEETDGAVGLSLRNTNGLLKLVQVRVLGELVERKGTTLVCVSWGQIAYR